MQTNGVRNISWHAPAEVRQSVTGSRVAAYQQQGAVHKSTGFINVKYLFSEGVNISGCTMQACHNTSTTTVLIV